MVRPRPLLMVHLIDVTNPENDSSGVVKKPPVVAWSMSFPTSNVPQKSVDYFANATFVQEQMALDDMSADEELIDELQ